MVETRLYVFDLLILLLFNGKNNVNKIKNNYILMYTCIASLVVVYSTISIVIMLKNIQY
jgi:hypothetical protein